MHNVAVVEVVLTVRVDDTDGTEAGSKRQGESSAKSVKN